MNNKKKKKTLTLNRRDFLKKVGLGTGALLLPLFTASKSEAERIVTKSFERLIQGKRTRQLSANRAYRDLRIAYPNNGEESDYETPFANFQKGLPHNSIGEVSKKIYNKYLSALKTGDFSILENLNIGPRGLANPQAGLAFALQGSDSQQYRIRQAPKINSAENSAEMVELYWQSLARDIHFSDYDSSSVISDTITDLNKLSNFNGPKVNNQVTTKAVFRGNYEGDLVGPYLSQFLLKDLEMGSFLFEQKQRHLASGVDFMTNFNDWLFIQNGNKFANNQPYEATHRYIRNGRDLASYVSEDEIYQAYYNAALIITADENPILDKGNPYNSLNATQPVVTFGIAHILTLLAEVSQAALKAIWFQKWYVHRRMRPEEFGGRIHQHIVRNANYSTINDEVLNSNGLAETFNMYGSYFLPQAFDTGSPTHPAYGAGHATVAGACATILKAFFDENQPITNPVVASADGLSLDAYVGSDASQMTIGGEINKLAANISIGRNFAGIHWRTDYTESMKLGEKVATRMLIQQSRTMPEKHSFSFTKFNGEKRRVRGRGFIDTGSTGTNETAELIRL